MNPNADALLQALLADAEEFVLVLDGSGVCTARSASWQSSFNGCFLETLLAGYRSRALGALRRRARRRKVELVHLDRAGRARRIGWYGVKAGDTHLLVGRDRAHDDRRLDQLLRLQRVSREATAELRRLAETDPLTGVANRRAVLAAAHWVWGRPGPASAVLLDLDHFKRVNDRWGHEAGDALLAATGAALQASAGAGAVVGRWGGEEFACFYPGDATPHAEAMLAAVRALRLEDGEDHLGTTVSIGVALVADTSEVTFPDALAAADAALYEAKNAGRDRIVTRPLSARTGADLPAAERRLSRRWTTR